MTSFKLLTALETICYSHRDICALIMTRHLQVWEVLLGIYWWLMNFLIASIKNLPSRHLPPLARCHSHHLCQHLPVVSPHFSPAVESAVPMKKQLEVD